MQSSRVPDVASIKELKSELRRSAFAKRDALPAPMRAAAAETIAGRTFPVPVPAGAVVSGYSPMNSELNPVPLMRKLADAGAQLALPVVQGRGKPLVMRAWSFGEGLTSGIWGIREPTAQAAEVFPDIMLVPLAAFDSRGHRIGYGAGYYDRAIERLTEKGHAPRLIGIAFGCQEVPKVPDEPHDVVIPEILTEGGLRRFGPPL